MATCTATVAAVRTAVARNEAEASGSALSSVEMSPLKRLTMRPMGVSSKKVMGERSTRVSAAAW